MTAPDPIPLARPVVGEEEERLVLEVLRSGHWSLGPKLAEFERGFAGFVGAPHASAVSSGTAGLHLALRAVGVSDGDEVVTTPFSFVASANVMLYERAKPVFADIDPVTLNLDPAAAADAVTSRTKALLPVHVFGYPAEIAALERIGLPIVEDACEALGACHADGTAVGTGTHPAVFGFYPNKQLATGEGGMLTTADPALKERVDSERNQGRAPNMDWLDHDRLGFNYRLSDIACAVGIAQLGRLQSMLSDRARAAGLYGEALAEIEGVTLPCPDSGGRRRGWFVYVIQLPRGRDRDDVIRALGALGVPAKPYFPAIHLMSFYRETFGHREGEFPVCEDVAARSIALPFFVGISEGQVARVAEALAAVLAAPGHGCAARPNIAAAMVRFSARFSESQHDAFRRLNDSIVFDWRLGPYDIEQSVAHATMLAAQGIISTADRDELHHGLSQARAELAAGTFPFLPTDEDIHMAIERRVTELVGPVGGRLHTARSRNDQVATDMAMFTRAHAEAAAEALGALAETLIDVAERHLDWPMPGYTHLQRAQPVYLSHHLLAYAWMFLRDRRRFFAARDETALLPLGAGALAGVNFDTDRRLVARDLGFSGIAENSIDAVSNRDFVLDYLSAASTCATHLSRLGAEIVLWSSEEFGFCEVSDAWASGSSIMPQKKNPDAAELLRAKAPRIAAHLVGLQGVMHGLPLTYNKDMQEDKEHLFDAVDTLELSLEAATGMLESISFRRERLAEASGDEMLAATDVADLLVKRGMPFREAHGVVAALVKTAVEHDTTLSGLTLEQIKAASPLLDEEYYAVLSDGAWLEGKVSEGGTSLGRVREQLVRARGALA